MNKFIEDNFLCHFQLRLTPNLKMKLQELFWIFFVTINIFIAVNFLLTLFDRVVFYPARAILQILLQKG
jgi:uncharacterized membrane protein